MEFRVFNSRTSQNKVIFANNSTFRCASFNTSLNQSESFVENRSLCEDNVDDENNDTFLEKLADFTKLKFEKKRDRELIVKFLRLKWFRRTDSEPILNKFKKLVSKLMKHELISYKDLLDLLVKHFLNDEYKGKPSKYDGWLTVLRESIVKLTSKYLTFDDLSASIESNYPGVNQHAKYHVMFVYNVLALVVNQALPAQYSFGLLKIIFEHMDLLNRTVTNQDRAEFVKNPNKKTLVDSPIYKLDVIQYEIYKCLNEYNRTVTVSDSRLIVSTIEYLKHQIKSSNSSILQAAALANCLYYLLNTGKQTYAVAFCDMLMKQVESSDEDWDRRVCAGIYLSEFLVRSFRNGDDDNASDDRPLIENILRRLATLVHSMLDRLVAVEMAGKECAEQQVDSEDLPTESAIQENQQFWYHLCQMLFYVLSYRYCEFLDSRSNILFVKSLGLSKIIYSKLNPLKYCHESIVETFTTLMHNYQLVYCSLIVSSNCFGRDNEKEQKQRVVAVKNDYEMDFDDNDVKDDGMKPNKKDTDNDDGKDNKFFVRVQYPFDISLLIKSRKYFEPIYREFDVFKTVEDSEKELMADEELSLSKLGDEFLKDFSSSPFDNPFWPLNK